MKRIIWLSACFASGSALFWSWLWVSFLWARLSTLLDPRQRIHCEAASLGDIRSLNEVILTVLIPAAILVAYEALWKYRPRSMSRATVAWPMLAGIWLLHPWDGSGHLLNILSRANWIESFSLFQAWIQSAASGAHLALILTTGYLVMACLYSRSYGKPDSQVETRRKPGRYPLLYLMQ